MAELGPEKEGVSRLRAGQLRLQTLRLLQVVGWTGGLIIILLVGIGPALLRGPLHSHMSGAGTASARVVLLQDNALGQLCLMQQVARAETGTPDANAGGPLPAELALDSSLLQWAAKAVEAAYAPPQGVLYSSPTAPSYHRVLLGVAADAPAEVGGAAGAQVLWAVNTRWALATAGFYRIVTFAALLPRQLDLSVSLQAGSCDPADTGGMVPLARVPLPGSASTSASECPDLQGAVVVRSADAPFDANKYFLVDCPTGLAAGGSSLRPWSSGPLLVAAAAYSAAVCGLLALVLTAIAARAVAGLLQRRYVALVGALRQLHDVGSVQLPDGSFLVKVRAHGSGRVARAILQHNKAGAVAEATEDDGASSPRAAAAAAAGTVAPPPSRPPGRPAARTAAPGIGGPYAQAAKEIEARAAAAAAAKAARLAALQELAKQPPAPPPAPPRTSSALAAGTPYAQQPRKASVTRVPGSGSVPGQAPANPASAVPDLEPELRASRVLGKSDSAVSSSRSGREQVQDAAQVQQHGPGEVAEPAAAPERSNWDVVLPLPSVQHSNSFRRAEPAAGVTPPQASTPALPTGAPVPETSSGPAGSHLSPQPSPALEPEASRTSTPRAAAPSLPSRERSVPPSRQGSRGSSAAAAPEPPSPYRGSPQAVDVGRLSRDASAAAMDPDAREAGEFDHPVRRSPRLDEGDVASPRDSPVARRPSDQGDMQQQPSSGPAGDEGAGLALAGGASTQKLVPSGSMRLSGAGARRSAAPEQEEGQSGAAEGEMLLNAVGLDGVEGSAQDMGGEEQLGFEGQRQEQEQDQELGEAEGEGGDGQEEGEQQRSSAAAAAAPAGDDGASVAFDQTLYAMQAVMRGAADRILSGFGGGAEAAGAEVTAAPTAAEAGGAGGRSGRRLAPIPQRDVQLPMGLEQRQQSQRAASPSGGTEAGRAVSADERVGQQQQQQPRDDATALWEAFEKDIEECGLEGGDDADEDDGSVAWEFVVRTRLGTYLPLTFPASPHFESKNVLRALLGLKYFVVMPAGHKAAVPNAAAVDGSAVADDLAAADITRIQEQDVMGLGMGGDELPLPPRPSPGVAWPDEPPVKPYKPTPYELYVRDLEQRIRRDRLWRVRRWHRRVHSTENRWLQVYQDSKTDPQATSQQLLKRNAAQENPNWEAEGMKRNANAGLLSGQPALGVPGAAAEPLGAGHGSGATGGLSAAPQFYDAPPELQKLLLGRGAQDVGNGGGKRGDSSSALVALPASATPPAVPPALAAAAHEVLGLAGALEMAVGALQEAGSLLWGGLRRGAQGMYRAAAAASGRGGRGPLCATGSEDGAAARLVDGGAVCKVLLESAVRALAVLAQEAALPRAKMPEAAAGLQVSAAGQQDFTDDFGGAAADARSQEYLRYAASSLRASAREVVRQFLRDLWAVPPEALPAPQKRAVLLRLGQHVLVARRRTEAEAREAEVDALKGVAGADADVPPVANGAAWSRMVWDAALEDARAALRALSPEQQQLASPWRRRAAVVGAALAKARSRLSRMLGLRLLCILLLGSLVPFFTSLVAASTAALWNPAGPWASSAVGFAALLVPGSVCLALLAADVCAAMGISPREALAFGRRRRPGPAFGALMSNDSFRGSNRILPLVQEAHGQEVHGEDLAQEDGRMRPEAGPHSRWPSRAHRLLRAAGVALFAAHFAAAVWYCLMVVAWLGLSAVLGAFQAVAIVATIGSGVSVLAAQLAQLRAQGAAVRERAQQLVEQHTANMRAAAHKLALYERVWTSSKERAAYARTMHAQVQAMLLNVNRSSSFVTSRIAGRALPAGWVLASLAAVAALYACGLVFIYLGARAFGLAMQWGIAAMAPLSALGSFAQGRASAKRQGRKAQALLPAAVGQAVNTAKDAAAGLDGVDGGIKQLDPLPQPPEVVKPETELENGVLRINTVLTALVIRTALEQQRDDTGGPKGGCCRNDDHTGELLAALMKLWSELLDKPEEPEDKEDLLPFIWAAVQGLVRDSRSLTADLTNLGRTIGVDHWLLEKAAGGGGRDGPASLHSRTPDLRKVPYETGEILRRLKALSMLQPQPYTPHVGPIVGPGGWPNTLPSPSGPLPIRLDDLTELIAQLQRCLSSAELLDTAMGNTCNKIKEIRPDMQALLLVASESKQLDPAHVRATAAAIRDLDPTQLHALLAALKGLDPAPLAAVQAAILALPPATLPAVQQVAAAAGALPGKVQPHLDAVQERISRLDAKHLAEVQEAIDKLNADGIAKVQEGIDVVVRVVGELPGKVEPPLAAVQEAVGKIDTAHLVEVQAAIDALSADGIAKVQEAVTATVTLVAGLPVKVEPPLTALQQRLEQLDASHLAEVQDAIDKLSAESIGLVQKSIDGVVVLVGELPGRVEQHVVTVQERVAALDTAHLDKVQDKINGLKVPDMPAPQQQPAPSPPSPLPRSPPPPPPPPPSRGGWRMCGDSDVVHPEPQGGAPWQRLEQGIAEANSTSFKILEIVQKIAPGRDGKDGADGDDGQTGPSVIVPSAPAPAPGPAGPVPDLLPELQRLLQELQVAVLDRVGGVERSLDRGLATSTSRLLAAIAGIGAGGGGAGGGGKAEVDLEPLRVQLLQMDEKLDGLAGSLCEGVGLLPDFCAGRPGLPGTMTVAQMLHQLRMDLLEEIKNMADSNPGKIIGWTAPLPGEQPAGAEADTRVMVLLREVYTRLDVLVRKGPDNALQQQVALLVALVERLWSWLTGESRDGGPGPVEERGAGGGLTLVLQDVVNTQLTVHNKKVVKSVLRGLEDPLAPLARIEVRLRELQGEEVGLLDMGTVAEARAMAAAGALADATATAGASASATVTLRTGAQRKPSFADLYRLLPELLQAVFNLRLHAAAPGSGQGNTPAPAAPTAGGIVNKWQLTTQQSAISEIRSRLEQLHVLLGGQVDVIRQTLVPEFADQVHLILMGHRYTKRFAEAPEGETLMEVVERLLDWKLKAAALADPRPALAAAPAAVPSGNIKDRMRKLLPLAPYILDPVVKRQQQHLGKLTDAQWLEFGGWLTEYAQQKGIKMVEATGGWMAPYYVRGGGTVMTYLNAVEAKIKSMVSGLSRRPSAVQPERSMAYSMGGYDEDGIYDDDGDDGADDEMEIAIAQQQRSAAQVRFAGGGSALASARRGSTGAAVMSPKASGGLSRRGITFRDAYVEDGEYLDEGFARQRQHVEAAMGAQGVAVGGDVAAALVQLQAGNAKSRPTSAAPGGKGRLASAKPRAGNGR